MRTIRGVVWIASFCTMLLLASRAEADPANIGNWSGSLRSWNHGDFTSVKAMMTLAGHTVEADGAMSAANLANDDLFVVGQAAFTPGAGDLSDLSSWINSGGILLLFTDSNGSGAAGGNGILGGIGSSITISSAFITRPGPLLGGNFATTGPPYNIVGGNLNASPGNTIGGGSALINGGIHYQAIGSGYVYVFGDRYDHDIFNPSASNNNGKFFLNLAMGATGTGSQTGPVPEPGCLSLFGLGAAVLLLRRRRRAA